MGLSNFKELFYVLDCGNFGIIMWLMLGILVFYFEYFFSVIGDSFLV